MPFSEVFGTETTEEHMLSRNKSILHSHDIPFSPSARTARTVQMSVKCIDCDKPRVVFSASKLDTNEKKCLSRIVQLYEYSCGSVLLDKKTMDNQFTVGKSLCTKKINL